MAGILVGRRGSVAPAICPGCTLLVRPVFAEAAWPPPEAAFGDLASALVNCIAAGARVINLSLAASRLGGPGDAALAGALDLAMRRGVLVVAAAGNQGLIGGSPIARHPWVIPVVGCDLRGHPSVGSNLGASIGRRGLSAPGVGITSLGADGQPARSSGTSVAAPFVTGAIALLMSEFPEADSARVRRALSQAGGPRRMTVVPALLDARAAYHDLARTRLQ